MEECGDVPNAVLRWETLGLLLMPMLAPVRGEDAKTYTYTDKELLAEGGQRYRNYELHTNGGRERHVMRDREGAVGCVDWGLLQRVRRARRRVAEPPPVCAASTA